VTLPLAINPTVENTLNIGRLRFMTTKRRSQQHSFIYILTLDRQVIYCGHTTNPNARFASHRRDDRWPGDLIEMIFVEYGYWDMGERLDRELSWIDFLRDTMGYALRNVGVDELREMRAKGAKGKPWSEERKKRLSEKMTGRKFSDETKAKMSAGQRKLAEDPARRAQLSGQMKRAWADPEKRGRLAAGAAKRDFSGEKNPMSGKKHGEETRAKMREASARRWGKE